MTLPKLLFMLMQKNVTLYLGAKDRIRFRPRGPVSEPMKAAIAEHKPALLALLRGEDLGDWVAGRLQPAGDDEYVMPGECEPVTIDYDDDYGGEYDPLECEQVVIFDDEPEFIDDGGGEPSPDEIEAQIAEFEAAYGL